MPDGRGGIKCAEAVGSWRGRIRRNRGREHRTDGGVHGGGHGGRSQGLGRLGGLGGRKNDEEGRRCNTAEGRSEERGRGRGRVAHMVILPVSAGILPTPSIKPNDQG